MTALRNDKVGIAFRRLYIELVHGLEHFLIAVDDHLRCPAALDAVAVYHPDKAFVGIRIHKNLHIHPVAHVLVGQHKDALHHNHFAWLNVDSLLKPGACDEIICGHFYGSASMQVVEVLGEQRPFYSGRFVIVHGQTLLKRNVGVVLVIAVLRNDRHFIFRKAFYDSSDHGRLPRAGSSGYADCQHVVCVYFEDCIADKESLMLPPYIGQAMKFIPLS